MTQAETKKLLGYITAAYPSQFKGDTENTVINRIAVWQNALQEYSYTAAMVAANAYIAADTRGFAPAPGQIIAYIHESAPDTGLSAQEAWALVRKTVSGCGWDKYEEAFRGLPEAVRKAVGSSASLKELGMMDIATFESVAGSNFMRTYNAVVRREKEHERMPTVPAEVTEGIAEELEARRTARQVETKKAEVIPFPLTKTPEDPPQMENVSEETIDRSMQRLREKLGV